MGQTARVVAGEILLAVCLFTIGVLIGLNIDDDPTPPAPKVNLTTEALLESATIEMHGYDETGKPGTFQYKCKYEGEQLVCTQQEDG